MADHEREAVDRLLKDVDSAWPFVERIKTHFLDQGKVQDIEADLTLTLHDLRDLGDARRRLSLVAVAKSTDGTESRQTFEGVLRFEPPEIDVASIEVEAVAEGPPSGGALGRIIGWAFLDGLALSGFTLAGLYFCYWALTRGPEQQEPNTIVDLLILAVGVGWTGSCGAALRSFMDRYRNGFEFDRGEERVQWPPRLDRVERFSTLMAPTFVLRPFLGAIVGPIAFLTVQIGGSTVQGRSIDDPAGISILSVIAVSGLAGMFSKSIWDNLNKRADSLFKPK